MKHGILGCGKASRRWAGAAAAVVVLALGASPPRPAEALSALAAGIPDDVAAQGVAFGAGYNYATRADAEARALLECRKQEGTPASTIALCKIIAHFDNQCAAISLDPAAGTPGFGWAIAPTAAEANRQALANCRQTAGPNRAGYCVESLTDCDTQTPAPK